MIKKKKKKKYTCLNWMSIEYKNLNRVAGVRVVAELGHSVHFKAGNNMLQRNHLKYFRQSSKSASLYHLSGLLKQGVDLLIGVCFIYFHVNQNFI